MNFIIWSDTLWIIWNQRKHFSGWLRWFTTDGPLVSHWQVTGFCGRFKSGTICVLILSTDGASCDWTSIISFVASMSYMRSIMSNLKGDTRSGLQLVNNAMEGCKQQLRWDWQWLYKALGWRFSVCGLPVAAIDTADRQDVLLLIRPPQP